MTLRSEIRRAVRLSLMAAAAASAAHAPQVLAQDAAVALDTVIVTGSRIAKRDNVAESPIMTIDAEAMKDSGNVTIDHYLNTLPQIVPAISSQSNNPSSNGRAFIDLRGLGSNRNLVLVDGRRGMGSTSGGVVDVNTIPAALIERVEVISGGAGATYGPDAVAGVINFIMKKDYDGVSIDSSYRITDENDGEELSFDFTAGEKFADGRGSAVFNASYFKREAIYKGARDFSAQASGTTGTFPGGGWSPGTNTPTQAAVDAAFGPNVCNTNGGQAGFGFNPSGSLFCTGVSGVANRNAVGFTGPDSWIATRFYPDFFSYNFEPDNILVLPLERWSLYSHFELDLSEKFRPYAKAMFTNYNALQELAATPAAGSTGFTVPVTNPFIPAQLAGLLATRATPGAAFSFSKRFNDVGGRTGYNTHDVWQLTTGAKGDIAGSWQYDVYATFGRSVQNEVQGGNIRRDRVQGLLDNPNGGTSGSFSCAGGLNLFGAAPISQACIDYISLEAKNLTTIEQMVVEGVVTGDLFDMPAGKVQAAFGASFRDLEFDFQPDGGLQPGLVAGFNQQLPISGALDYTDLFTEVSIPMLADMPMIQKMGLTLGARTTDNNLSGSETTWKATLDWTMNDIVRFRGGFQHAVRSPNISELFAPQLNNFPTFTNQDPCNTTGPNASQSWGRNGSSGAQVQALCAAQSAVAGGVAFVQPFSQATGINGGNPNLTPEKADSFTAGFVVTSNSESPMLERLSMSIDYFQIDLEEVIAAVGASTIVQRCFNRDGANPTFSPTNSWCQLFTRDASNGGVVNLQQFAQNQAFIKASGVDLTVNWGFGLSNLGMSEGAGDLSFQLVTSYTGSYETQTTSVDPIYDYQGTIGSGTGSSTPEYKINLLTQYSRPNLRLGLNTRFISSMVHANTVTGGSPLANTGVPDVVYMDFTGSYDLTENFTIRLAVNNLGAKRPPLYSPNVQANTDPSLYDVLGRRYFLGFNWRM